MQYRLYFSLVFLSFILLGCSKDSVHSVLEPINFVTGLSAIDVGDAGNASDVVLLFNIVDPNSADRMQIFLHKGIDLSGIDASTIENASTNSLFTTSLSGNEYAVSLPASLVDLEGDPIQAGVSYIAGFIVEVGADKRLNFDFTQIELTDEHYLNGDYVGTWDDNLYRGFGISAQLRINENIKRVSGQFYYSNSFTSCCGGSNDGNISFTLADDGTIENFEYRQSLVSFMGGSCPGLYKGEGKLDNYTTLVINFSGDDCEGPHTGGVIRLRKQ